MRIITSLVAAFVIVSSGLAAQELSPLQVQLHAWCGATFSTGTDAGLPSARGFCKGDRQGVHLVGPSDQLEATQAQVDLRPVNAMQSRQFLIVIVRSVLADKDWNAAERFVDAQLAHSKAAEKAEKRFGPHSIEFHRNSDVMATVTMVRGAKATHKAFEW